MPQVTSALSQVIYCRCIMWLWS